MNLAIIADNWNQHPRSYVTGAIQVWILFLLLLCTAIEFVFVGSEWLWAGRWLDVDAWLRWLTSVSYYLAIVSTDVTISPTDAVSLSVAELSLLCKPTFACCH